MFGPRSEAGYRNQLIAQAQLSSAVHSRGDPDGSGFIGGCDCMLTATALSTIVFLFSSANAPIPKWANVLESSGVAKHWSLV
jgi:hypothetical protein